MIDSGPSIPLVDALNLVDAMLSDRTISHQKVGVRDALGQWLAAEQVSRLQLPPFDKAAMDGYAILEGDTQPSYEVLETILAGGNPVTPLRPGTAVKVMTGAPVPLGTGQVIPIEHVRDLAGAIEVTQHSGARNICPQGEDVQVGDVILSPGARLGSLEIANLISCGITEVEVFRPIRLAVFSTGDEIVDDPRNLGPGRIMNVNGPLLALLGRQFSMDVVIEASLPDDLATTVEAISMATERADLVVLSGGVSVGDRDFVGKALAEAGLFTHFSAVAIKPGRPLTFATRPDVAVFGLPGNPVSVYVMFHVFVLRAVARMCGSPWRLREITLTLSREFRRRKTDRVEYVPARLENEGTVAPVEFHGSAHLTAMIEADGLLVIPLGISLLAAGQHVRFLPIVKGWQ